MTKTSAYKSAFKSRRRWSRPLPSPWSWKHSGSGLRGNIGGRKRRWGVVNGGGRVLDKLPQLVLLTRLLLRQMQERNLQLMSLHWQGLSRNCRVLIGPALRRPTPAVEGGAGVQAKIAGQLRKRIRPIPKRRRIVPANLPDRRETRISVDRANKPDTGLTIVLTNSGRRRSLKTCRNRQIMTLCVRTMPSLRKHT